MAQQQRARVTRERVLEGAAEVFARSGYAGASLSEIAAESG
ncbi:TetR family transcriptional regulator, partial [Rhizobium johnstonii]